MATTSLLDNESLAHGRAGLPTPASTASYWHRDPSAKLIGQRTSSELPLSADVVVIGSGITGAFAAQELVKAGRSVVMLEAREACWGATGRVCPQFTLHDQVLNLSIVVTSLPLARVKMKDEFMLIPSWLLERLLSNHSVEAFNLQTKTPVTRIEHYKEGEEFLWRLRTQRGQMRAKDVLLATNAYTSHLVPDIAGLITPVRAQVCALEPPPGATQLMHSYVWMKGADHQYLIQRDSEDTQVNDNDRKGATNLQPEDRYLIFWRREAHGGRPRRGNIVRR